MGSYTQVSHQWRRSPDEDPETMSFLDNATAPKPWKKVALAVTLLCIGATLLFAGVGVYVTQPSHSGAIPLLVLGSVCFLPGFYYSRIAYYSWRGYEGYHLSAIPDF
ncbi:hypothetical protein DUNSADRAFT_17369 [Dunaliella salina]|uniref:Transmembrane protein 230 n=1 Tax=Dunaliella salina TaxID=3046 RepID=A0ABQ7H084_DUNSA|nr:hypothetical protein DUNSADRAFT_17369 [Dunaliella salina]|eukprot:KAF5840266.1 hypothetical protein DUNSADRAFT_17369 [Dunaliella salina]